MTTETTQVNYIPQIIIGVIITVAAWLIIAFIKRFIKKWDDANTKREQYYEKMDRNILLLNIKSDCTISGLKQMNGQTSKNFTQVFDSSYADRTKDIDWIEPQR